MGQRIIEVNGQSLLGASHNEAVSALREAGECIQLLVCDGWNTPTPRTPDLPLILDNDKIDSNQQKPTNSGDTNGQVNTNNFAEAEDSEVVERPPSANQEKVSSFQPYLNDLHTQKTLALGFIFPFNEQYTC